jgi:hypothetical protein
MINRINKYRIAISSVFLLGYVSFMFISLTHVHNEINYEKASSVDNVYNSHSTKSLGQNEENCPICQFASSISVNTISITVCNNLVFESIFLLKNETIFTSAIIQGNYLRGPPEFNIHLA